MKRTKVLFLTAILAALVYVTPVYATEQGTITVTGGGIINVEPEIAHINIGVETQELTIEEAQKNNSRTISAVIAAVKSHDITENDIQTTSFHMRPVQEWHTERGAQTVGFMVSNYMTITVRDISIVGEVLSSAIAAGANVSNNISFGINNTSEAYNRALSLAVADAKDKAQAIADSLGESLGNVVHVSEHFGFSGISPLPTARAEASFDSARSSGTMTVPVQSGELAINATVNAVFSIAP